MKQKFVIGLLTILLAGLAGSAPALAEGATNARERFFVKRQNCAWTEEMGKAIYECVKANNGFNAHWCHNEALDQFCPPDESAVPAPPAGVVDRDAGKAAAARQGEENLRGTIEREKTMLKYKDCKWTDEMGKAVYECVKRNDGFGVHWCHDEALQTLCPAPAADIKG
jgi:hypothetical protein